MAKEIKLMQGNQAIAEGAIYAGARFYAGYPITPSSEIAEECSRKLPKLGGVYIQMEDEIASIAAVIGASLAGAKSFTATSGPGFSLMQENLGLAVMGEVPCVVVSVQRAGPSTGLATRPAQSDIMQIRWGRHGDQSGPDPKSKIENRKSKIHDPFPRSRSSRMAYVDTPLRHC